LGGSLFVPELRLRRIIARVVEHVSRADFISKISIVAEEADETLFWLELLVESQLIGKQIVQPLMSECE
jgi:four helix bundle protein